MDYTLFLEAVRPLWWVLPLLVLLGILKSRWVKGMFGEVSGKCGSAMVLRTTKPGANAGNKFWGCSAYPRCREVQDVA